MQIKDDDVKLVGNILADVKKLEPLLDLIAQSLDNEDAQKPNELKFNDGEEGGYDKGSLAPGVPDNKV